MDARGGVLCVAEGVRDAAASTAARLGVFAPRAGCAVAGRALSRTGLYKLLVAANTVPGADSDKGAASADEWLPPQRGYRCRYVAAQVTVKARWSLSVTTAERRAIGRALDSCVTVETPSTGRASPGWAPSSPRSR